ncbi:MAG: UDP-2,4-diacetamido-2,4,6-trideoxy-beta-L-altropyranose hydrolase [Alphaproteobacteria bacterium]
MTAGTARAIFRADASPAIGGGHVARCLTLADALREAGWQCRFACTEQTPDTMPALAASGHGVDLVAGTDASLPTGCGDADLLVVDHYRLDAAFERAHRDRAGRILAIDDLANRSHDCDVLLDTTPGRRAAAYAGIVPAATEFLLGPDYALLRPAFAAARRTRLPLGRRPLRRIVVGFGATDPDNLTAVALAALAALARPLEVTVMLGAGAPHRAEVARLAAQVGAKLAPPDAGVAGLLAHADLAIGAGGTSAWERCCLGLPTVVLVAADNQRANADALQNLGAALVVPHPDAALLAEALAGLLDDAAAVAAMAARAARLCDGYGVRRTLLAIAPPTTTAHGRALAVRPARSDDEALLLAWRRDAGTRAFARNPNPPSAAEHHDWLDAKLADPLCLLHLLLVGDEPVGVLRLDWRADLGGWEVSLTVAPDWRGRGIGVAALDCAARLTGSEAQWAFIKQTNAASLRAFARAGFAPSERPDWYVRTGAPRPMMSGTVEQCREPMPCGIR